MNVYRKHVLGLDSWKETLLWSNQGGKKKRKKKKKKDHLTKDLILSIIKLCQPGRCTALPFITQACHVTNWTLPTPRATSLSVFPRLGADSTAGANGRSEKVHCHNIAAKTWLWALFLCLSRSPCIILHSDSLSWEYSSADTCHRLQWRQRRLEERPGTEVVWGRALTFRSHLSSHFLWKIPEGVLQFVTRLKHKPDHAEC